jgi:PHD/YefM family antitoxin component YafN of YafNO toxin-antitoxin module
MRYVSATEFARNFAQIQHEVHQEVIAVTSDGRTAGYLVSPEHYAEFAKLRAKARQNLRIGELPDDVVEALRNTKMDAQHDELNKLMDD